MSDSELAEVELPLDGIGARLTRAREASGLSRAQLAAQTRIPERHLVAIEAGNYAALPGKTYAIGFTRTYAKALGLDEAEFANGVRAELAEQEPEPRRVVPVFEPGDPARVPSSRLTWLAGLAILLVLAGLFFAARSMLAPGGNLPSILPEESASPAATSSAAPAPAPTSGPVVFTALEDAIWVKFSDGQGNQLMQKQLAKGESYTVPDNAGDVKIWTGRPEALAITVGGQAVPKLSDVQKTMKDVPVTAAALLARGAPPMPGTVAPIAAASGTPAPNNAAPPRRTTRPAEQRSRGQRLPEGPATAQPSPSPLPATVPAPAAPVAGPAPAASAT